MLTYAEFQTAVAASVPRFQGEWLNPQQDVAVSAAPSSPLYIVAGPGTGKTTVLALRVLRHVFIDGYPPEAIIATTFTRKAASELRSRILSWGVATHQNLVSAAMLSGDSQRVDWLKSIDINQVKTGTLDSLAEEMLGDDRMPTEITPAVIEAFMARGILRRHVLFQQGRHRSTTLESHLTTFSPSFPPVSRLREKLTVCQLFSDRVLHDAVDLQQYAAGGPGAQMLAQLVDDYHQKLNSSQFKDFALLEWEIYERLRAGRLTNTSSSLLALLVDEFQDTNYLQEQIYYNLCQRSGASFTVVGDDDQSLYRFRGATVEIFADFSNRLVHALGNSWVPVRVDLTENYRSTERIVALCNHFVVTEPD